MPDSYDAILRGGRVIDPANGLDGVMDVALADGRIARVEPTITGAAAAEHDLSGKVVMPGIVDLHVHLSPWLGGAYGHKMLAAAGVTTALDMAGPIDGVVRIAAASGTGLTIACIDYVRPGHTVGSEDPSRAELDDALSTALGKGAIGLKLLGGHFPLTPEASAATIAAAGARGAYIAFHAGTLELPMPTPETMENACVLADGHRMHLAHINSYVRDRAAWGEDAIRILGDHPNIWSESYLAPFNGVGAKCSNGVPESQAPRRGLVQGGFEPTEAGMAAGIAGGWVWIHKPVDGVIALVTGEEGLAHWRSVETDCGASFMVNPPEPRLRLVTAKKADGGFAVDCLATDGGGIPRNDIVERGLPLVRLSALTLTDFVVKSSLMPAKILGLARKGHLTPGADGDVTVLDMDRLVPVLAYAGGRKIMQDGRVTGSGCRFVTTAAGVSAVTAAGLDPIVVELGAMLPDRAA